MPGVSDFYSWPSREEVTQQVADVWRDVAELDTDEGHAIMRAHLATIEPHEE